MAINSRITQDRRKISRIPVRINCHFTHAGVSHEALMTNISLSGAFFSSKYLPQVGATVALGLKLPDSKKDLEIQCTVIRGNWGMSDHGKLARFGVRFSHTPLDLLTFISKRK